MAYGGGSDRDREEEEGTMPSPIQEVDEEDEEEGGGPRIEEVHLEDENEGDIAQAIRQEPTQHKPQPAPQPKATQPRAPAPAPTQAAAAAAKASPPTLQKQQSNSNKEKVPTATGVSMEMMRVALAGWNKSEQGPTNTSPVTEEDLENMEEVKSYRSSVPDPQAQKLPLSGRVNQAVCILNIGFGLVYLCWRVFRGMNPQDNWRDWAPVGHYFVDPDDPERPWTVLEELKFNWFSWVLFFAEMLLMVTVWLGHASRCFPCKRTKCTMDDLVEVDYELSRRTAVCIVLPTRGEPLNVLREVILNAMSLNLWPGKLDVRKNARLVVIDDRRRAEVLLLIALCYRLAALFCNNRKVRAQLKLEGRSNMSLAAFYDHYLQCTASFGKNYADSFTDIFSIADMIMKLCKDDCIPAEWDGLELPSGTRIEPKLVQTDLAKVPRLREDFDDVRQIMSLVYYSRPGNEFPAACPIAGMLNGLLFPEDPADADIMGGARFLVTSDPHHALQTEYLQRTMPYFFKPKMNERTGNFEYEDADDVAFVQVALRVQERRDKDPLSNRDFLLNDIINVGRDGVGGTVAKRQGCMYRIDVLKQGKDVKGHKLFPGDDMKQFLGKGIGFFYIRCHEWLPTSVELFRRGYRSVYVNEIGETLSLCFDETKQLQARVQEIFENHLTATETLFADPMGLLKARYTTAAHRLFVVEELLQGFFTAMSVELLLLCTALYCYLWKAPFYTHGLEILFFFIPYYFTAALPTAIALNWRRTLPDPTFRSIQLSFATAFVPFVAYLGAGLSEMSRVVCSRSGRRQFNVEGCPTWPLYATLVLLVASMVVTFINWARAKFQHPGLWVTTVVVAACTIGMILPTAMRGIKFQGIPSFYLRYLSLAVILVVVACWQGAGAPGPAQTAKVK